MTLDEALQQALVDYGAGRLPEAEQMCRRILATDDKYPDALHLLGLIAAQVGRNDVAVELIVQAIRQAPHFAPYHSNLGHVLRMLGKLEEALAACREAVRLQPDYVPALVNLGCALGSLNQLDEAETVWRDIRDRDPSNADAVVNLGNIHYQRQLFDEAEGFYREAMELAPGHAEAQNNLAVILQAGGRTHEAEALCRSALAINANSPEAHCNLGRTLIRFGRFEEAENHIRTALSLKPDFIDGLNTLAMVLHALRRFDESEAACREVLRIDPGNLDGHNNLGAVLQELDRPNEAETHIRAALALEPDLPEAHHNLASVHHAREELDEAELAASQALRLSTDSRDALNLMGVVLERKDRLDESEEHIRRALELHPDFPEAHHNLAAILQRRLQLEEAEEECLEALRLRPSFTEAAFTLALIRLTMGDYEQGWPGYENRWEAAPRLCRSRNFSAPLWDGEALPHKIVLFHAEQGFGDTVQFARFLSLAAERVRVVVEVEKPMKRLISSIPGIEKIVAQGEDLPVFDLHCPMLSLPLAFGTTIDTIPNEFPYLTPPAERVEAWAARVADLPGLRVGIAWAGNPLQPTDRRRSVPAGLLGMLSGIEGISFVSLQKDKSGAPDLPMADWTAELTDFAETAALIQTLDLVIAVDTAVVHLAGALGKPVWLLNRFDTDWRWLAGRTDSIWYDTLFQFRQPSAGDWSSVIAAVADALAREVARGSQPSSAGY